MIDINGKLIIDENQSKKTQSFGDQPTHTDLLDRPTINDFEKLSKAFSKIERQFKQIKSETKGVQKGIKEFNEKTNKQQDLIFFGFKIIAYTFLFSMAALIYAHYQFAYQNRITDAYKKEIEDNFTKINQSNFIDKCVLNSRSYYEFKICMSVIGAQ